MDFGFDESMAMDFDFKKHQFHYMRHEHELLAVFVIRIQIFRAFVINYLNGRAHKCNSQKIK